MCRTAVPTLAGLLSAVALLLALLALAGCVVVQPVTLRATVKPDAVVTAPCVDGSTTAAGRSEGSP